MRRFLAFLYCELLVLFVFCLWQTPAPPTVLAQGSSVYKQDFAWGDNNGIPAVLPFATITVCLRTATGTPCSPTATIYSNQALSTTQSNPFQADANGRYSFWAPPGAYEICVAATGFSAKCQSWIAKAGSPFGGPVPWIDVTTYNARLLPSSDSGQMTTATTNSTTSVTVARAADFIVNDDIVISQAGASTSQSTPSAPIATVVGATGNRTISYKLIGVDSLLGLTAPSSAGSVTNASLAFGDTPHVLTALSRSSNVVSGTISSSNPFPASSGSQCAIVFNVTSPDTTFDGIQTITFTSTSTFTYSSTGSNETATVNSNTAVWLADCQVLSGVSRTGTQITATTAASTHNFAAGPNKQLPTKAWLYGITPTDLDGIYTIASTTSNTFVINTQFAAAGTETGSLFTQGTTRGGNYSWNQMGALVYPEIVVSTPTPSAPTQQYIVCANYGSGYVPAGMTLPGDNEFEDYGPFQSAGFALPPAMGNSNPCGNSGTQNQVYVGTITGINGATFTVSPSTMASASGLAVFHDNSVAAQSAGNAECAAGVGNGYYGSGMIYFPGGNGYWIFNAPMSVVSLSGCSSLAWKFGAVPYINGGIYTGYMSFKLQGDFGTGIPPSGGSDAYVPIYGYGNPMFWGYGGILTDHVTLNPFSNGAVGIYENGELAPLTNTGFYLFNFGTARGLVTNSLFSMSLHSGFVQGYPEMAYWPNFSGPYNPPEGMIEAGPLVGAIESITSSSAGPAGLFIDGVIQGSGRGIEFNASRGAGAANFATEIDNFDTMQAPWTPLVWFSGQQEAYSLVMKHNVMDSNCPPMVANFDGGAATVDLIGNYGCPLVGGDGFSALNIRNEEQLNAIGQNTASDIEAVAVTNPGPASAFASMQSISELDRPLIFPEQVNYPLAWTVSPPAGLSATATGSGSWSSGSHTVTLTGVGWNGGETVQTSSVSVSTSGSQAIQVSFAAPVAAAFQGVNVYIDGERQNGSLVTSSPVSYSGNSYRGGPPDLPGTGFPLIDQNQVTTPLIRTVQLDQTASKNFAGQCTMASGTMCTATVTATFNSTPLCFATDTATSSMVAAVCSDSSRTVTVTAASSNSHTFNFMLVGNPN